MFIYEWVKLSCWYPQSLFIYMGLEFPCSVISPWIYTAGVSTTTRTLREATKERSHCLCWLDAVLLYTICTSRHLFCVALDWKKRRSVVRPTLPKPWAWLYTLLHFTWSLRYAVLCIGKAWEDVNTSTMFPNDYCCTSVIASNSCLNF